ncbi:MAG TPA: ankyrin repeat domain-containing protein [Abditibacteriaceae bacterium]|jgi:ankyrin repeat protein
MNHEQPSLFGSRPIQVAILCLLVVILGRAAWYFTENQAPPPAPKTPRSYLAGTMAGVSGGPLEIALVEAAARGDEAQVQNLLAQGAKPNALTNGTLALATAAQKGYLSVVRLLLDSGANVNYASVGFMPDPNADPRFPDDGGRLVGGQTALFLAAGNGHVEVIKLLLSKGADVTAESIEGNTPLVWAAFNGQAEAVRLLLQAGADPNQPNKAGTTALAVASQQGHLEVVRVLKESGAR